MSVNPVSSSASTPVNTAAATKSNVKTEEKKQNTKEESPAAVYQKSADPVDRAQIDKLLKESKDQTKIFAKLVESVMGKQGTTFGKAAKSGDLKLNFQNIEVDDETRAKAKDLISEDGYYGVKQTSERLLSFAKAYAGDDPTKIAEMKNAFEAGYKAAEKAWGGELPEICKQTYDAVMKGFDEMGKTEGE